MTAEFCQKYFDECSSPNQLDLDESYCDVHAAQTEDGKDQYWSHPLGEQGQSRLIRSFNNFALPID